MSNWNATTQDMLVCTRRLIKEAAKTSKRARAAAEGRERVRLMLLKLSRYDDRYAELLTTLEEHWHGL